jgi:hypothetical protein
MYRGDSLILLLLSLFIIGWLIYLFRGWLMAPPKTRYAIEPDPEIPVTEAVELLEFAGYQVLTGKRRIPVTIQVNDRTELESRLFVDHFAAVEDKLYVVKLARDRKPLEWTGSAVRDQLLVYQLLYQDADGILYVDPKQKSIEKIRFTIDA